MSSKEAAVVLRQFRPEDAAAVRSMFAEAWRPYVDIFGRVDPPLAPGIQRYIDYSLEHDLADIEAFYMAPDNASFWVAELEGEVIGAVGVKKENELVRMMVSPKARGRGVARRLHNQVVSFVKKRGNDTVVLTTGSFMIPAIKLYNALGYKLTGNRSMELPDDFGDFGLPDVPAVEVCFEYSIKK